MSYILSYLDGNVPANVFLIIMLVLSCVQIAPVKINPLTAIKEFFVAPMRTERAVNGLKDDLKSLKDDFDEDKAIQARIRILAFGESLIRKGQSTKERFDQIMEDIDTYELYCANHPEFKNNKTVATTQYIKEKYYKGLSREEEFLEIIKVPE